MAETKGSVQAAPHMLGGRFVYWLGSLLLLAFLVACQTGGGREQASSTTLPIIPSETSRQPMRTPPTQTVPSPQTDPASTPTLRLSPAPTKTTQPAKATGTSNSDSLVMLEASHHPPPDQGLPGYAAVASNVLLFTTLADALAQRGAYYSLPAGEIYLSYTATQIVEGQTFFQVGPNRWLRSLDASLVQPSTFSGLLFDAPPVFPFGWAVEKLQSTDGNGQPRQIFERYQHFQLAAPLSIDTESDRLSVGPDEFLPRAGTALVQAASKPPAKAADCRWIEINLREQTLLAYESCQLRFATLISSGDEAAQTPTGVYQVRQLVQRKDLRSLPGMLPAYFLADVPHVIYFQYPFAIHAAYWHDSFGRPGSHGCINLSPSDAAWLYAWVRLGDIVLINS